MAPEQHTRKRTLLHHWLSAPARKVRLALHEKKLEFQERIHIDWERMNLSSP